MDRRLLVILGLLALLAGAAGFLILHGDVEGAAPREPDATAEPSASASATPDETSQATGVAGVGGRTISGRVVDSGGAPIAGAKITVGDQTIAAGDDGRFSQIPVPEVRGLESFVIGATEWHTTAVFLLEGTAKGPARKLTLRAGENSIGDVVLRASGAVEGTVFDDRDLPVEGAFVTIDGLGRGKPAEGSYARTDARGKYKLSGVPPGEAKLRVWLERRESVSDPVRVKAMEVAQAPPIALLRTAGERVMRGKVISSDNGEPVGGIRVRVAVQGGEQLAGYTGLDGTFAIINLPDMSTPVPLEAEGHGFAKRRFGPYVPSDDSIVLTLEGGAPMALRVLDAATGAPIEEYGAWTCSAEARAETDEQPPIERHPGGDAVVRASAPRRTRLVVNAPGYLLLETHVETTQRTVEVRLQKGSPVTVKVLRRNQPLAGARVSICFPKAPDSGSGGGIGLQALQSFTQDLNVAEGGTQSIKVGADGADLGSVTPPVRARSADRERITGPDGIVRFEAVPPGTLVALVTDKQNARARSSAFKLQAGEPGNVVVAFQEPGSVTGTVAGILEGEALTVLLKRNEEDEPNFRKVATVQPDGTFRADGLRAGKYLAAIQYPDDASPPDLNGPGVVALEVPSGGVAPIELDTAKDGRATIQVQLSWIGSGPGKLRARWQRSSPNPTRIGREQPVDDGGRVLLQRVLPGTVHVDLMSAGQLTLARLGPIDVAAGQNAQISKSLNLGTVRIRVGPKQQKEGVHVSIQIPAPGVSGTAPTNEEGELVIAAPEGQVSASANVDGKVRTGSILVQVGVESLLELRQLP